MTSSIANIHVCIVPALQLVAQPAQKFGGGPKCLILDE